MNYETWEKQTKNQETFSFFILNKMKEEKIESTDFYKAADLTRDLFSKINCHRDYLPSKITATYEYIYSSFSIVGILKKFIVFILLFKMELSF